jgi:periplasmic protein CpxP/Spy
MKKFGLLLSVLLMTVVFVKAQPDPAEMVKRQVDQLTEACSLTKDQVPKVEVIVKKYSEKMMAMFQEMGGGGDRDAMREKMTKNREEQSKEIKAILTADQAKKYDKFLAEQMERMRQMGGPGGN